MGSTEESVRSPTISANGLFIKLAVVAFCLSLSSSAAFILSFQGGRLAYHVGSPSDEAILYSFLYGLLLSQIATLFLPRSRLNMLFSRHFSRVFLRSLVIVVPCWVSVALIGSRITESIIDRVSGGLWEEEWCQISLVLISASITLLTWHVLYHKTLFTCTTEPDAGAIEATRDITSVFTGNRPSGDSSDT